MLASCGIESYFGVAGKSHIIFIIKAMRVLGKSKTDINKTNIAYFLKKTRKMRRKKRPEAAFFKIAIICRSR